jgi:Domain of unknown function (DUF4345)
VIRYTPLPALHRFLCSIAICGSLPAYGSGWESPFFGSFRDDTQTVLFRAIWFMIFCGGVGRLVSLMLVGMPPVPFVGFIVLEIVGAPLFIWWQVRIAK